MSMLTLPFGNASCIPVEIMEAILVEAFDATSAAHAGLVNKAFRKLTLPIAFRFIRCGQPSAFVRSILQWNLQLAHCPEIGLYVRVIALSGTVPGLPTELKRLVSLCSGGYPLRSMLFEDTDMAWLCNSSLLPTIVSRFTQIRISTWHGVTTDHIQRLLIAAPLLDSFAIGDPDAHWIQHVLFAHTGILVPNATPPSHVRRLTVAVHHDSEDGLMLMLAGIQRQENWALVDIDLVLSTGTSLGVDKVIQLAASTMVSLRYVHKGPLLSVPFSLANCLVLKKLHLRASDAQISVEPLLQIVEGRSTAQNGQLNSLEIGLDGSTMEILTWDKVGRRLAVSGADPSSITITLRPAQESLMSVKDIACISSLLGGQLGGGFKFSVAVDTDPFPDHL